MFVVPPLPPSAAGNGCSLTSLSLSLPAVTTAGGTHSPTRYLQRWPLGPGGGAGERADGGGATPAQASAADAGRGAATSPPPALPSPLVPGRGAAMCEACGVSVPSGARRGRGAAARRGLAKSCVGFGPQCREKAGGGRMSQYRIW